MLSNTETTLVARLLVAALASAAALSRAPAAAASVGHSRAGCAFNLDSSSPRYPPHLIDAGKKIVLPTLQSGSRVIDLQLGQTVNVACLGAGNSLQATGRDTNEAVCGDDSKLVVNSVAFSYNQLGCVRQNKEVLLETASACAGGAGTRIDVGWQFGSDFIRLYDMCHDKTAAANFYVNSDIVGASVEADDSSNGRPSFSTGGYYPGLDVNDRYTQVRQQETIAGILGSDDLGYFDLNGQVFLSRGHLAPDGDFIDAASQDASYYFMNVAPQWQVFNAGSWVDLEAAARDLATSRRLDLRVTTGQFGVATLADVDGVQRELYLAFDEEDGRGLLPVPRFFWKVLHDPAAGRATAFVGINNPHLTQIAADDFICANVCNRVPWVDWTLDNARRGYMYCCTAAELRAAIPYAPDLGDVDLLV